MTVNDIYEKVTTKLFKMLKSIGYCQEMSLAGKTQPDSGIVIDELARLSADITDSVSYLNLIDATLYKSILNDLGIFSTKEAYMIGNRIKQLQADNALLSK